MSTDHQQYSTANQRDALARYAADHGLTIIRTYADEGKSGLTAVGRAGLCTLLGVVVGGQADFGVILVYDVSRWGRFQDADESAYYEFLCRRAGIRIEYCMEVFRNDGTPMSAVMKGLKRVMAGEYSRELSEKVLRGKCRLARMGYRHGGMPGYGLRRMLVDSRGNPKQILEHGQHKYLQEDRISLVLGPPDEVKVVRWIFRQFAERGRSFKFIADSLNDRQVPCVAGGIWTRNRIASMIRNEKYIGRVIFNRFSTRLKAPRTKNPREKWICLNEGVAPIISTELFDKAQRALQGQFHGFPEDAALDALRRLWATHGTLNSSIINGDPDCPGSFYFESHFGGLTGAYRRIGFKTVRNYAYLAGYLERYRRGAAFRVDVQRQLRERGVTAEFEDRTILRINRRTRVKVNLCPCRIGEPKHVWMAQHHLKRAPDWLLTVRLAPGNEDILDYHLIETPPHAVLLGVRRQRGRYPSRRLESKELGPLLDVIAGGNDGNWTANQ